MKLLQLPKPHLLVMVGIAGSGKSLFAEKFADTFQSPLLSDSPLVHAVTGAGVHDTHVDGLTKHILDIQLSELLKTGRTIVADVPSHSRTDRMVMASKARKHGYETLYIWVQTDQPTAKDRSLKPGKNATNKQLDHEQYDRQIKHFTPPNATESTVVISGKHTYASQAKVVLKKLSGPRAEIAKQQPAPERSVTLRPAAGRHNITIR